MNRLRLLGAWVMLLLFVLPAGAQVVVKGPAGARKVLKAYAHADAMDPAAGGNVEVANLRFPLEILETSPSGRLRVDLGDRVVWLERAAVTLDGAPVDANCSTVVRSKSRESLAASRGANRAC